eukprot:30068-Pelagococcus_subviridis.AAC.4
MVCAYLYPSYVKCLDWVEKQPVSKRSAIHFGGMNSAGFRSNSILRVRNESRRHQERRFFIRKRMKKLDVFADVGAIGVEECPKVDPHTLWTRGRRLDQQERVPFVVPHVVEDEVAEE